MNIGPNGKHWRQRKWTEKDSKFIKENYKTLGPVECARRLEAPLPTVMYYAQKFSLRTPQPKPPEFSEEDLAYIKQNYGKKTLAEMADHLHRKTCGVHKQIRKLAKKNPQDFKPKSTKLTPDEKQRIKRLHKQNLTSPQISAIVHRSVSAVDDCLIAANLTPHKHPPKPWSDDETKYLINHYKALGAKECMANLPGRTLDAIHRKIHMLRKEGRYPCPEN